MKHHVQVSSLPLPLPLTPNFVSPVPFPERVRHHYSHNTWHPILIERRRGFQIFPSLGCFTLSLILGRVLAVLSKMFCPSLLTSGLLTHPKSVGPSLSFSLKVRLSCRTNLHTLSYGTRPMIHQKLQTSYFRPSPSSTPHHLSSRPRPSVSGNTQYESSNLYFNVSSFNISINIK